MRNDAVVLGGAMVIFILSAVAVSGVILAANAWHAAEKSASFWRGMLGTWALWYGRPTYYRWMGGLLVLLGTGGLAVFIASLVRAR